MGKFIGWKPNPPFHKGDYFMPYELGYDHRFVPCLNKRVFRELPSIQKWCSPYAMNIIKRLPHRKLILPELLVHIKWFPLDPMLIALMDGTWGMPASWKVYARLLLVKRLRDGSSTIFQQFSPMQQDIEEFVLYGGSRRTRNTLLKGIHTVTVEHMDSSSIHASARFLGSCLSEDSTLALLRPFHWLKATYIATDPVPMLGLGEFQKENRKQKQDLLEIMKLKLSKKMIEELS